MRFYRVVNLPSRGEKVTETRAVVGMPLLSAIPAGGSDSANTAYGIVMAVGLGLFGVYMMARKFSRDKVGFHEDRAREDVIKSLQDALVAERLEKEKALKAAEEAWDTRTEDAAKIAELTTTVKFLNETVERLRKDIHKMADKLSVYEMRTTLEQAKTEVQK